MCQHSALNHETATKKDPKKRHLPDFGLWIADTINRMPCRRPQKSASTAPYPYIGRANQNT